MDKINSSFDLTVSGFSQGGTKELSRTIWANGSLERTSTGLPGRSIATLSLFVRRAGAPIIRAGGGGTTAAIITRMQSSEANDVRVRISSRVARELSIEDYALIDTLCAVHMDINSSSFSFDDRIAELLGDFGRCRAVMPGSEATAMG